MSDAPAFPPEVAHTIRWLRGTFATYYQSHEVPPVHRATRREFGFIKWPSQPGPPPFIRHLAYGSMGELQHALNQGPHSAYYSTAYYRHPGERLMADKQWLGAELIFDLDADHLEEVERGKETGRMPSLQEQLRLVKDQFRRLLDEFLFGDFGLSPDDLFLTFSGGRGYHAHVTANAMMELDAKARREIVKYVTGKFPSTPGKDDIDVSQLTWQTFLPMASSKQKGTRSLETYPSDAPGWRGRVTRALATYIKTKVLDQPEEIAISNISSLKISLKDAREFVSSVDQDMIRRISEGKLEQGKVQVKILKKILGKQAIALGKGETDEPVTSDVKRLIRLPGSLHGKTGLRVVTLNRDELDDFDPFRDALALPLDPVRFKARFDQELTLGGERVRVEEGEVTEVPIAHAAFWASRQAGTVASG